MLEKKSPVKLLPLITGMLDGASHPINPNPITLKSLRSQSLSKHVNLPPEACATLKGFLAVTGDFKNPELIRHVCLAETRREGDEREEVPKPTMVDAAAAIFASLEFRPKASSGGQQLLVEQKILMFQLLQHTSEQKQAEQQGTR